MFGRIQSIQTGQPYSLMNKQNYLSSWTEQLAERAIPVVYLPLIKCSVAFSRLIGWEYHRVRTVYKFYWKQYQAILGMALDILRAFYLVTSDRVIFEPDCRSAVGDACYAQKSNFFLGWTHSIRRRRRKKEIRIKEIKLVEIEMGVFEEQESRLPEFAETGAIASKTFLKVASNLFDLNDRFEFLTELLLTSKYFPSIWLSID